MFSNKNQFSLHIESIKQEKEFETYIEAIIFYYENYSDQEMTDIVKMLNQKILDSIEYEAQEQKLLKHNEEVVRLI